MYFSEQMAMLELTQGDYQVRFEPASLRMALATNRRNLGKILSRIPQAPGFVNYATLAQKAKVFDDRMLAALDLANWKVKGPWLVELTRRLEGRVPVLAACCSLFGREDWSSESSQAVLTRFLGDEMLSKPLGFYAGDAELEGVFRRDRLLQEQLTKSAVEQVQAALHSDPDGLALYQDLLQFQARLTGPSAPDRTDLLTPSPNQSLFPPARSPEASLAKELLGKNWIPEGFQLLDELIAAVQKGDLSLQPKVDSGLYERQLWALEALLTCPEPGLDLDEEYQSYLVDLFKGLFCMTRETHIKQLPSFHYGSDWGQAELLVRIPAPRLSLEPMATSYRRRAESYSFWRWAVAEWKGPDSAGLDLQIDQMTGLFHGAYLTVCQELGLPAQPLELRHPDRDLEIYRQFAEQRQSDPDLQVESRHMVPLYYDAGRGLHKVLLFLGWQEQPLYMYYESDDWQSAVSVTHRQTGQPCSNWRPHQEPLEFTLLCPHTLEVLVPKLLNRQEFCDLCWATGSLEATLKALQDL